MKKPLFLSLLGLIICFSFSSCVTSSGTIVCFGDSFTSGWGVLHWIGFNVSYPDYLQKKVNIRVINSGKGGETTTTAFSRVDSDVLSKNPQIIIIDFGSNDVFQYFRQYGQNTTIEPIIETVKVGLQQIIDRINDGNRKIYVIKLYSDTKQLSEMLRIYDIQLVMELINQFDVMYNALAFSNDLELIENVWDGVWGIHMNMDGNHANPKGNEVIAMNIFSALEPYLRENDLIR